MAFSKFEHVITKGISVSVPTKEICIYDEAEYYNNNVKKIDRMRKMVGFYKRRVVEEGCCGSDLGICAAKKLLQDMQIKKESIDALVYVVQKPDYEAPATAFLIHNKLGLSKETPAFDINNGCAGFVYGLWVSSQMIESKTCKQILLVCADTPSHDAKPENRTFAPIFGDAGCAVLLDYSEDTMPSYFHIETYSDGFEALIRPAYGHRFNLDLSKTEDIELVNKISKMHINTTDNRNVNFFYPYMQGMKVFDFTLSVVPESIRKLMDYADLRTEEIDTLCLHQANKQIIQEVGSASGFPLEKVPYYAFENYGNNTMCSIPTTICSVLKEKSSNENVRILASGFGNGLTCASCIVSLDKIYNSGIIEYQKSQDVLTKEAFVEYWLNKMKGQ